MNGRILGIMGLVILLLLLGIGLALVSTARVQQTGTAAGIRYDFTHTGLYGNIFDHDALGFRYEQRPWFGLGRPSLEVAAKNGRLLVNRVDRGPIATVQQVKITSDSRVLVDDQERASN
jgi:hypothetical protein